MHSKPYPKLHTFSLILGVSGLLALAGGCPPGDFTLPGINQDPTANAGADRTIDVGQRVILNGLGTTDADDDALTFVWQQRSGPSVTLDDANTVQPSFVPVEAAIYGFALTVTDGRGGSDTSFVRVFVGDVIPPTCPRVDAGTDQTVNEGAAVRLRGGNSADPGGGPLTFDWFQLSGPRVSINGVFIVEPSFAAPQVTGADIELEFELAVTNEHGCPDWDTVVITVRDRDDPGDRCNGVICNDDGQFCNGVEACDDGVCRSNGDPCSEGDTCDEVSDTCTAPPECASDFGCDDALFCNGEETCVAGECQTGVAPCTSSETCDEDNDACPAPECVTDADCDDGLFCTGIETCDEGECRSSGDPCRLSYLISSRRYASGTDNITAEIQVDYGPGATLAEWNDIKAEYGGSASSIRQFMDTIGMSDYLDDGSGGVYWVTYNGSEFWTSERHYHATRQNGNSYGWFLYHDDIQGRQMALGSWWGTYPALVNLPGAGSEGGTCNEDTDACEQPVPPCVAEGGACDEQNLCCEGLRCWAGVCTPLAECTGDADCEDDDLCTIDSCIEGECTSAMVVCDDGDACTVDECERGGCVHTALTCNDDDPCTLDDCGGGECVFTTMECDDGDACTIDECVAGECVFTSVPCGNPPIAEARVVGTPRNEAISITLSATDPDGDLLTYSIVDGPAHGTLTGDPPEVMYTPNENYVGFDLFSFQADDGRSGVMSNTANVRIWVIDEEDLSGNTVTGHLLPGGTDVWSFQGVVGQRVAIKVSYGYPRARLSLYPPGGGALETTTRDGWIDWPLQNTGQYTVAVENPWSVSVGYNLSVLVLGAQLASLSDLDGGPITAGETLAGQLAPTGDIDVYTFEGVEGQRVLITISYGYPSARLALYPPDGGELEAWSSNLKIDRMLQTSGLYSIVVVRDVSVTIGYNLTLQKF